MPPRIPVVLVFVALYFAAAVGGGYAGLYMYVDLWSPEIAERLGVLRSVDGETASALEGVGLDAARLDGSLTLTLGQAIAFGAAALALPDAALRPAITARDKAVSALGAVAVGLAALYDPEILSAEYAVLVALAVGDAVAAIGGRRTPRAPRPGEI